MSSRRSKQGGATFVELVIAIVVLGTAVAGLAVFTTSVRSSADPMVVAQAVAVAEAYMEEIMLQPFADPNGGSETQRALFDDVADYDGLSDQPPRDQFGNALGSGLDDYRVQVVATPSGDNGIPAADQFQVSVTVSHSSGVSIDLTSYRTAYQ